MDVAGGRSYVECVWSDSSEKQRKPSTLEGSTGFSLTSCVSLEQVNTGKVYRVNNIGHLSSVCSVLRITCWYMAESRGARKTYWWGAKRMGLEEGECASAEREQDPGMYPVSAAAFPPSCVEAGHPASIFGQ